MKNEIKKLLYKEKPIADMAGNHCFPDIEPNERGITYASTISTGVVYFFIPEDECYYEGKLIFEKTMEAKELIRWITDFYSFETEIKYVNIK